MNTDISNMRALFGVQRRHGRANFKTSVLLPGVLAVLNLVFCGWLEERLFDDPEGYYLTLFLLVQSTVITFFVLGRFIDSISAILYRTQVMPVSTWSRYLLTVFSNLFSFGFIVYLCSGVLFLVVHYRAMKYAMIAAPALYLLLALFVVSLIALFLARSTRVRPLVPVGAAVIVFSVIFAGIYAFRSEFLLTRTPVLAWAVDGIFGAEEGALRRTAIEAGRMAVAVAVVLGISGLLFGRRKRLGK